MNPKETDPIPSSISAVGRHFCRNHFHHFYHAPRSAIGLLGFANALVLWVGSLLLTPTPSNAAHAHLETVLMPLDGIDAEQIVLCEVTYITYNWGPSFSAIAMPYEPPYSTSISYGDINLVSRSKIKIETVWQDEAPTKVFIDYTDSVKHRQTKDLLRAILKCIDHVAGDRYQISVSLKGLPQDSELWDVLSEGEQDWD